MMKVDINCLLTTLTGGCPVIKKNDQKELEALYKKNVLLNNNLPYNEETGISKEELRQKNVEVKSEAIFGQVKGLEEMRGSLAVAGASLRELIENGEIGSEEYLAICEILRTRAKGLVKKDTLELHFPNEIQQ